MRVRCRTPRPERRRYSPAGAGSWPYRARDSRPPAESLAPALRSNESGPTDDPMPPRKLGRVGNWSRAGASRYSRPRRIGWRLSKAGRHHDDQRIGVHDVTVRKTLTIEDDVADR